MRVCPRAGTATSRQKNQRQRYSACPQPSLATTAPGHDRTVATRFPATQAPSHRCRFRRQLPRTMRLIQGVGTSPAGVGSGRRRRPGAYPALAPPRVARRRSPGGVRRRDHRRAPPDWTLRGTGQPRAAVPGGERHTAPRSGDVYVLYVGHAAAGSLLRSAAALTGIVAVVVWWPAQPTGTSCRAVGATGSSRVVWAPRSM